MVQCKSNSEEFTHAQLDSALQLLLVEGAGVLEGDLHNYSVHSFRIFAACALLYSLLSSL